MSLRNDLVQFQDELNIIQEKKKFRDPIHLKYMIGNMLQDVCKRIEDYLDGDLEAAIKLPHHLMDLELELQQEEDSEWKGQTLGRNASTQDEEDWREIIDKMIENDIMPRHVNADKKFLGGKQFQRAKEVLKAAMAGKMAN